MKLIHCSDLHLDSKMESNFTPGMAQQRNHEICLAFERMVKFAEDHHVSAIMICGDLFDTSIVRQTTVDFILDVIRRFPKIIFFYLQGNHDESYVMTESVIPQNLKLFTNHWKYYHFHDVVIAGIEIDDSNSVSMYSSLKIDSDKTNIVMMHGQIGTQCGADQVNLTQLKRKNIDYLALGHLHSYQEGEIDYRGRYCYCGCLEGRGFDETGKKGFVLIDTDRGTVQARFVDFASRHFHKINFDISNCKKITDILSGLRTLCCSIPESDFIQITLSGNNISRSVLDTSFPENALAADHYYVKIYDHSKFAANTNHNGSNSALQNEFIKSIQSDLTLSEEEKNAILLIGLHAIQTEENPT